MNYFYRWLLSRFPGPRSVASTLWFGVMTMLFLTIYSRSLT